MVHPASAAVSASSVAFASATTISAECLAASKPVTLTFTKATSGSAKIVCDAVVKSE